MGASVVAGVDVPPILEPTEHIFDLVPLAIQNAVVLERLAEAHDKAADDLERLIASGDLPGDLGI